MKQIVLLARPATGGIRTHVTELIARLPRDRWSVTVAAPGSFLNGLPSSLPSFERVPCPISAKPSVGDLLAASIVRRAASHPSGTSIVHAHGLRAGLVAAVANRGRRFPLVVTYHNIPPSSPLARMIVSFIARRSSATIAVSVAIATQTGRATEFVPNGIDVEAYDHLDRDAARAAYDLGGEQFTVVSASRLSREKGIAHLIASAKLLPDITFIVAGDGPERAALESVAGPNVRLLGRSDRVRELLAAGDLACIPSLTEGQGIFALEAMAAGLPVVASNVGGLPEMVEDGITGLLIEPASPKAIANAIRRLQGSSGLRSRLGAAARMKAREIGAIDIMMSRITAIYERVGNA